MTIVYGNSVQEFYLRAFRENFKKRKERIDSLKTKRDALNYIADVRKKVRSIFQFPEKKCPLNPRFTGELPFPGGKIKKLLFESREHYTVSASLAYPAKVKAKNPAILFLCGHSETGRMADYYQTAIRQLAARGFIVLGIDPVGQGERIQISRDLIFGGCCTEHNIHGKQLLLTGEWFGNWRTYDAIRGIDYLLTLPEVDASRIGVHGTSGGGTLTTLVSAADDRLAYSAPSCYITTWLRNVENELPADIEQMPPKAVAMGLEIVDFLIAGAPKPRLILGERNDFFDPRGTKEAYEELKAFYKLLGREDDVELFIGPGSHSLSRPLREAAYKFFCKHAGIRNPSVSEGDPGKIVPAKIWSAPKGSVLNLPGEKKTHDLIVEKALALKKARKKHTLATVRSILKKKLGLGEIEVPKFRSLRVFPLDDATNTWVSRFGLETEKDLVMCVLHRRSKDQLYQIPNERSVRLYIPHLDSNDELGWRQDTEDCALYALDCRGVGECTPTNYCPATPVFYEYGTQFHYTVLGEMCGLSYLGGKVKDILSAVELLSTTTKEIRLEARGLGGIPALLAAVLSDKIKSVKFIDVPESWESMVLPEVPAAERSPRSVMIDGILKEFDLPDLRALIKEEK